MGKKSGPGMNIPDHISESLETIFWVKFFYADPDPGSFRHTGSDINTPDPQHWFLLSVVRSNLKVGTELTRGLPELVQHFHL